jgi:hypothetical protein
MIGEGVGGRARAARSGWLAGLALFAALLSLLLNLHLLAKLREAERAVAPLLPLIESLADSDGPLRPEIRIPSGTPIDLDIPIDERVTIRVDTLLSIDARVVLPLRSPLGNYDVPVPVRGTLPLRGDVPVHLRHTFQLRTRTNAPILIPLEIDP